MDGVPYPVWAQPNVGPGMMMFPDQNYSFPEAEYVDEYPVAQDGGEKGYSKKSIIAVDDNIELPYEDSLQYIFKKKEDKL